MEKIITKIDSRGVAKVTLNNPSKHNAFDDYMITQLSNAFTAIAENSDVRLMILASKGQSFSAGVEGCWVIPDVYTVLRGCRLYPGSHPGSFL